MSVESDGASRAVEPQQSGTEVRIRRALLTVSDKRGLVDFARGLAGLGIEIVSTGGTARNNRIARMMRQRPKPNYAPARDQRPPRPRRGDCA